MPQSVPMRQRSEAFAQTAPPLASRRILAGSSFYRASGRSSVCAKKYNTDAAKTLYSMAPYCSPTPASLHLRAHSLHFAAAVAQTLSSRPGPTRKPRYLAEVAIYTHSQPPPIIAINSCIAEYSSSCGRHSGSTLVLP